ncbi:ATP-binding cassette domain-containing protein [Legionella fallonii]|uniref:Uncharacterized protein n=1 Tax=Legionella fallonii LLAP-10 TaxID=1212491 RepID=A0A098G8H2_9GAMM|nr:ATP-binding cassette domain-containing protein [Legionella fallonii]CEG57770.1 protein of unknown function [Legionella fallonii LLAP-10]
MGEQAELCQQAIDTIFTEHYQTATPSAPSLNITNGGIIIDQVSFGFKSDNIVIKDLNVHISGGSKVDLVGYSGAGKSTVIVIAHRLSTILSMDNILVMDNGKIIETGNHKQLIDEGGFYKTLWDAQSGHSFI